LLAYILTVLLTPAQVAESLPAPVQGEEGVAEVDALEAAPAVMRDRSQRVAAEGGGDADGAPAKMFTKRKRKKRPGKPPLNFNPKVKPDPERWLPRWQRKGFRGRKKKKQMAAVGKGTQGSAGITEAEMAYVSVFDCSCDHAMPSRLVVAEYHACLCTCVTYLCACVACSLNNLSSGRHFPPCPHAG